MPRINRKNKKNGTRTKTKPGANFRVYCPTCEPIRVSHPQENVHVSVDGTNPPRFITCKNGHKTAVHR